MSGFFENPRAVVRTGFGKLAVLVDGAGHAARPPVVLCQRSGATMRDWDPELVTRLAAGRRVIRFDSAGVGDSEGEAPGTIAGMAEIVPALLDALDLDQVDLLGWSLGGYVAQATALTFPERVRRVVIAAAGPEGPRGAGDPSTLSPDDLRPVLFPDTELGRAAACRHFTRIGLGAEAAVAVSAVSARSLARQRDAMSAWETSEGGARSSLRALAAPLLVIGGLDDVVAPPEQVLALALAVPHAKLVLYPDAGHAFLFQHAEEVAREVMAFLSG